MNRYLSLFGRVVRLDDLLHRATQLALLGHDFLQRLSDARSIRLGEVVGAVLLLWRTLAYTRNRQVKIDLLHLLHTLPPCPVWASVSCATDKFALGLAW